MCIYKKDKIRTYISFEHLQRVPRDLTSSTEATEEDFWSTRVAMGRLDEIIVTLSDLFEEYNTGDNQKQKRLGKDEIAAMLAKEVSIDNFNGKVSVDVIKQTMEQVDKNKDSEIKILEFCRAVTNLAVFYYRRNTPGENV
ncbi:uncharacterized protein ACBT44_014365 [Syngnathus typhle]